MAVVSFIAATLMIGVALWLGAFDNLVRDRIIEAAVAKQVPGRPTKAHRTRDNAAHMIRIRSNIGKFQPPLPILAEAMANLEDRDLHAEEILLQRALPILRDQAQNSHGEWMQWWLGVPMYQYPNDLMMYQDLIWRIRPDVIIETGTMAGGLTLFLSTILDAANPEGRVITVDLYDEYWNPTLSRNDGLDHLKRRITFIHGGSTDRSTIEKIDESIRDEDTVLVILDSLHEKFHVLKELELYSPFVTKGSYLICTDTHLDGTSWMEKPEGPLAAVREFIAGNPSFKIDRSLDRYFISANISGYLRRVN